MANKLLSDLGRLRTTGDVNIVRATGFDFPNDERIVEVGAAMRGEDLPLDHKRTLYSDEEIWCCLIDEIHKLRKVGSAEESVIEEVDSASDVSDDEPAEAIEISEVDEARANRTPLW